MLKPVDTSTQMPIGDEEEEEEEMSDDDEEEEAKEVKATRLELIKDYRVQEVAKTHVCDSASKS